MNEELNKSVFDLSQDSYNELFESFEKKMLFKGYTIEEWVLALNLKDLREDFSLIELEKYTLRISKLTDIIVTNYALASSNYNGLKRSAERSMLVAKQQILNEIEVYNSFEATPTTKKRIPSADTLETLAYNKTLDLQLNLAISEVFYNFWKIQYDKIYLLNQRVTSLNVLKNIESKGINNT